MVNVTEEVKKPERNMIEPVKMRITGNNHAI
jgi:hypothetical protein